MKSKLKKNLIISSSLVVSLAVVGSSTAAGVLISSEQNKNENTNFLKEKIEKINSTNFDNENFDKKIISKNFSSSLLEENFKDFLPDSNTIKYSFNILHKNENPNFINFEVIAQYKNITQKSNTFNLKLDSVPKIMENYLKQIGNIKDLKPSLEIEKNRKKINPLDINKTNINKYFSENKILNLPKLQEDFSYRYEYVENSSNFIDGSFNMKLAIYYKNKKFEILNNPVEFYLQNFLNINDYLKQQKDSLESKSSKNLLSAPNQIKNSLPSQIKENEKKINKKIFQELLELNEKNILYDFSINSYDDTKGIINLKISMSYLNKKTDVIVKILAFKNTKNINEIKNLLSNVIIDIQKNTDKKIKNGTYKNEENIFNNEYFKKNFGIEIYLPSALKFQNLTSIVFKDSDVNEGTGKIELVFEDTIIKDYTFRKTYSISGFQKSEKVLNLAKIKISIDPIFILKNNNFTIDENELNLKNLKDKYGINIKNLGNLFQDFQSIEILNPNIFEGKANIKITLKNNLGSKIFQNISNFKKGDLYNLLQYTTFLIKPSTIRPLDTIIENPTYKALENLGIEINFFENLSYSDLSKIEIKTVKNKTYISLILKNGKSNTFLLEGFLNGSIGDFLNQTKLEILGTVQANDLVIIPNNGFSSISKEQLANAGINLLFPNPHIFNLSNIESISIKNALKNLGTASSIKITLKNSFITKSFNNVSGFLIDSFYKDLSKLKVKTNEMSAYNSNLIITALNGAKNIKYEQIEQAGLSINFTKGINIEDILFIRLSPSQTKSNNLNKIYINVFIQLKKPGINHLFNNLLFKINFEEALKNLPVKINSNILAKNSFLIVNENNDINNKFLIENSLSIDSFSDSNNILNWNSILALSLKISKNGNFSSFDILLKNGLHITKFLSGFANPNEELNKIQIRAFGNIKAKNSYISIYNKNDSITLEELKQNGIEINFSNSKLNIESIAAIKIEVKSKDIYGNANVIIYLKNGIKKTFFVNGFSKNDFEIYIKNLNINTINKEISLEKTIIISPENGSENILESQLLKNNIKLSSNLFLNQIKQIKIIPKDPNLGSAFIEIEFKNFQLKKSITIIGFKVNPLIEELNNLQISGNGKIEARNKIIEVKNSNQNISFEHLDEIGLNINFKDFLNIKNIKKIELKINKFNKTNVRIFLKNINYYKDFFNVTGFKTNEKIASWNSSIVKSDGRKSLDKNIYIKILEGEKNISLNQLNEAGIYFEFSGTASIEDIQEISIIKINNSEKASIFVSLKKNNLTFSFNNIDGFKPSISNKIFGLENSFVYGTNNIFPAKLIKIQSENNIITEKQLKDNNLNIIFNSNFSILDVKSLEIKPNFLENSVNVRIYLKNSEKFHDFLNVSGFSKDSSIENLKKSFASLIKINSLDKSFTLSVKNGFTFNQENLKNNNININLFGSLSYEDFKEIKVTKNSEGIYKIFITLKNGFSEEF